MAGRMQLSQPLRDGYVECDECGHPLEDHGAAGCQALPKVEPCSCPVRITAREIEDIRAREGLPRKYEV